MIPDPGWSGKRLACSARHLSFEWLALNKLPIPDRVYLDRNSANAAFKELSGKKKTLLPKSWNGVYQRAWLGGCSIIAVDVDGCLRGQLLKTPKDTLVRHAPGAPEDYSPFGVFVHEIGHHVDYTLHPESYSRRNGFQAVIDNEDEISSAEYNAIESFAEAIRLFIVNPNLLRVGRPERWEFLTKDVGLKPRRQPTWRRVLSKAHPKVIAAVERWIDD